MPKALRGKDSRKIRLAGAGEDAHYPQMSMSGTRNRMGRSFLLACALALGAPAVAGGLDATDLRVQLDPSADPAQRLPPLPIAVTGRAPARCAPTVERASIEGNNLNIELAPPGTACATRAAAPFYLRLDQALIDKAPVMPGQVYRTRVYSSESGTTKLLSFGLLDTNPSSTAPLPENGLWWSEAAADTGPALAGNGASLESQNGEIAVGLFGFDDAGAATWYFGTSMASGRVASVPLVRLANGDPAFTPVGSRPATQNGPRLELEFLSPDRARAYIVRSEAGIDVDVRTLTLSRSRFSSGPVGENWSGRWVLVPDDGGTPRVVELVSASNRDAENFQLADASGETRLDCRFVAGTSHPGACTLSGSEFAPVDFDQIGLDRLSGHTGSGARATLLRVTR